MEGSVKEEYLKLKLSSLEKKQQELHSVIDQQIKVVLDTGNRWLSENAENRNSFDEMNKMVEDALWFVCETSLEIKEWNLASSSEESGTTSSEAALDMPPSHSADQNVTKSKMSRIKEMEETIPFLKNQLQTLEECLEKGMGELSAKHSLAEDMRQRDAKQQDEQIRKLQEELLSLRDQQKESMEISTTNVAENIANAERPGYNSFDGTQDDVQKMKDQVQKLELKIENQINNGKKVEEAIADLFQVKERVSELSSKYNRRAVGFSAECVYNRQPKKDVILKDYEIVAGNTDGSFSKETGHFTAPVKGLYAVYLKLLQAEDEGQIALAVDTLKSVTESAYEDAVNIFSLWACEPHGFDFGLMVRELDVNDLLCVRVVNKSEMRPAFFDCTFSSFLIQES